MKTITKRCKYSTSKHSYRLVYKRWIFISNSSYIIKKTFACTKCGKKVYRITTYKVK